MWPFAIDQIFFICFTAQYFVITTAMYIFDLWKRWQMEKDKPLWVEARYFPSWTHVRFSSIYISCSLIGYTSMLVTPQKYPKLQLFVTSFCWTLLFIVDWFVSVVSAAVFLMIKYQERKNPKGNIIAIVGILLLFSNLILIVLSTSYGDFAIAYHHNVFLAIHIAIYLIISLLLEAIYFNISYIFVFKKDSSVCAGIYGFLDGFVRPLFRFFYCTIKYSISIIIMLCVITDSEYNLTFYQRILPFLLEFWFISCFFTMRRNRPKPTRCIELKCWRPFIEMFWRIGVQGYNSRNRVPLRRAIQWADLDELAKHRSRLELIQKQKEQQKQEQREHQKRHSAKSKESNKPRTSTKKIEVRDEEQLREHENE